MNGNGIMFSAVILPMFRLNVSLPDFLLFHLGLLRLLIAPTDLCRSFVPALFSVAHKYVTYL